MSDVKFLQVARCGNQRGFFGETYSRCRYIDKGKDVKFVQDNHSLSLTTCPPFLRCIALPEEILEWLLTSLQLKLIKIGERVVRHDRVITFQLAEVAVPGPMLFAILAAFCRLRAPSLCA